MKQPLLDFRRSCVDWRRWLSKEQRVTEMCENRGLRAPFDLEDLHVSAGMQQLYLVGDCRTRLLACGAGAVGSGRGLWKLCISETAHRQYIRNRPCGICNMVLFNTY